MAHEDQFVPHNHGVLYKPGEWELSCNFSMLTYWFYMLEYGIPSGDGQLKWLKTNSVGNIIIIRQYTGGFCCGLFHGYGVFAFANGNVIDGSWIHGQAIGELRFVDKKGETKIIQLEASDQVEEEMNAIACEYTNMNTLSNPFERDEIESIEREICKLSEVSEEIHSVFSGIDLSELYGLKAQLKSCNLETLSAQQKNYSIDPNSEQSKNYIHWVKNNNMSSIQSSDPLNANLKSIQLSNTQRNTTEIRRFIPRISMPISLGLSQEP